MAEVTETKDLAILSTADDILKMGFRRQTIEVPEWGGRKVTVCELSPYDRVKAERLSSEVYVKGKTEDEYGQPYPDPLAWICVRSICGPDGTLLFREEQAKDLSTNVSGAAIQRIAEAAQALSQVQRPVPTISNLAHAHLVLCGMPAVLEGKQVLDWITKTYPTKRLPEGIKGPDLDDWIAVNVEPPAEKNSQQKQKRLEVSETL